jgi:hypothetical protein
MTAMPRSFALAAALLALPRPAVHSPTLVVLVAEVLGHPAIAGRNNHCHAVVATTTRSRHGTT